MSQRQPVGKVLMVWGSAYAAIEPIVIVVLSALGHTRRHGNNPLYIITDFVYSSIAFVKSMYIYKHVLHQPDYFPHKNDPHGLLYFISTFIIVRVILDSLWKQVGKLAANQAGEKVPAIGIFQRYSKTNDNRIQLLNIPYEIILILVTWAMYWHLRDIDVYAILLFGIFFVLLLMYQD